MEFSDINKIKEELTSQEGKGPTLNITTDYGFRFFVESGVFTGGLSHNQSGFLGQDIVVNELGNSIEAIIPLSNFEYSIDSISWDANHNDTYYYYSGNGNGTGSLILNEPATVNYPIAKDDWASCFTEP